jgi:ubiquinone/menaquinone biosynthesis C-methylase UbiE
MVSEWVIELLQCPETGQKLETYSEGLKSSDNIKIYPNRDGIRSLVYPSLLSGIDERMNKFYEWFAPFYDVSERYLGKFLTGVDMKKGREKIVHKIGLKQGMSLLEVSPGPGVFQLILREAVGKSAHIISVDLSLNMLRQCRKHHSLENIELIQANAQYLPFKDASFDALFHFGGVNLFNDPEKALDEFIRVVRPGGIIAWGDEQMSSDFSHPIGRKILPKLNPGFLKTPPKAPGGLKNISTYVVYEGLGYLNVAVKEEV